MDPRNGSRAAGGQGASAPGGSAPVVWQIAVGDELLAGRTAETNSRDIQRALARHVVGVRRVTVVPDDPGAIAAALTATEPGGIVFLTGGLGSTPDDLTRQAVADWAGVTLATAPEVLARLEDRCRRRGVPCGDWLLKQAQVPVGLTPLENRAGSAPGLIGRLADRTLVILPGVPSELRALLPGALAWLQAEGLLPPASPALLLRTAQVAETVLVDRCRPVIGANPGLHWSWFLVTWGVDILVTLPGGRDDPARLAPLEQDLRERLGRVVYATEAKDLTTVIQEKMIALGKTLAVAESCTAGLLGARLTDNPGSSTFFRGGVMAYADPVKRDLLGVPADVLASEGAVSRRTAAAMATGCRERLETDFALAVTGIAGPDGGTEAKPVGTTWIAVAAGEEVFTGCYRFPGSRRRNRQLTVAAALDTLRRLLETGPGEGPWSPLDSWRHEP